MARTGTASAAPAEKQEAPADVPLSFSDVQGDMIGRVQKESTSQFTTPLQESFKSGTPKQFDAPTVNRDKLIQAIRTEAGRLSVGVTVRHAVKDDTLTTIQFKAHEKQKRGPGTSSK